MNLQRIWQWLWERLSGQAPAPAITEKIPEQSGGLPPIASVPVPELDEEQDYQSILLYKLDDLLNLSRSKKDTMTLKILRDMVAKEELELPRMPALAMQLMALDIDGPEDSYQIAMLIKQDRDVTARVMEAANSFVFGSQPARTLEHAIVRLGLTTVQQIAVGASTHAVIYRIPGYDTEAAALGILAQDAALTCQQLARVCRQEPGAAFLSGLFHDVGKVLVLRILSQVRARTRGGRASVLLVRRLNRQLHVPLGAWFAQARGLPISVQEAISFHHEPIDGLSGLVWAVQTLQEDPDLEGVEWNDLAPPPEAVRVALQKRRDQAA
jgi:HD-like signal output (HDOD) protein